MRRVTFEVDTNQLFDVLQNVDGDTSALGQRLVECLLAPPGFISAVGLSVYGISLVNNSPYAAPTQEPAK